MGSGSSKGHYDDPRFRHESLEQWARRCAEERQRVAQQVMSARVGLSVVAWMCVGGCVWLSAWLSFCTPPTVVAWMWECVCVCVCGCLPGCLSVHRHSGRHSAGRRSLRAAIFCRRCAESRLTRPCTVRLQRLDDEDAFGHEPMPREFGVNAAPSSPASGRDHGTGSRSGFGESGDRLQAYREQRAAEGRPVRLALCFNLFWRARMLAHRVCRPKRAHERVSALQIGAS
jgi:hypothetical protein